MSLDQDFHDLRARLFDKFEAVRGDVVRRGASTTSKANRAAGIMGQATEETSSVNLFLKAKKVRREDGTITSQTIATADGELREGDKLTVNDRAYTVGAVEEKNPYGTTPIVWIAVLL